MVVTLSPDTTACWTTTPPPPVYGLCRACDRGQRSAADLFKNADLTQARLTYGDVERYLAQLASHPPDCDCGRCGSPRVSAQRVYAIASGWQRQVRATRVRALR